MATKDRLATKHVEAAKPRKADYTLNDGGGLYLLVKPNGAKLWRQRYLIGGKAGLLAHGEFGDPPKIGLAAARELRNAALLLIAKGEKPLSERHKKREEAKELAASKAALIEAATLSEASTFKAIACEWLDLKAPALKPVTVNKIRLICEQSIFPDLGALQIAEITGAQVGAMLKKFSCAARWK